MSGEMAALIAAKKAESVKLKKTLTDHTGTLTGHARAKLAQMINDKDSEVEELESAEAIRVAYNLSNPTP